MDQPKNPATDSTVMRFLAHAMGYISLEYNGFDWKGNAQGWEDFKHKLDEQTSKDIRDAQMILRGCIKQISFWTARKNRWENL